VQEWEGEVVDPWNSKQAKLQMTGTRASRVEHLHKCGWKRRSVRHAAQASLQFHMIGWSRTRNTAKPHIAQPEKLFRCCRVGLAMPGVAQSGCWNGPRPGSSPSRAGRPSPIVDQRASKTLIDWTTERPQNLLRCKSWRHNNQKIEIIKVGHTINGSLWDRAPPKPYRMLLGSAIS
jgi:hypothetical protein